VIGHENESPNWMVVVMVLWLKVCFICETADIDHVLVTLPVGLMCNQWTE
jgi:hypothetical protein